jgi:hypothetical protein
MAVDNVLVPFTGLVDASKGLLHANCAILLPTVTMVSLWTWLVLVLKGKSGIFLFRMSPIIELK